MVETPCDLFDDLPEQERAEPRISRLPWLRDTNRCQVELRSLSLEDRVAADHRVRLVWAFCETLDLGPLYDAIEAIEGRPGHPPADPPHPEGVVAVGDGGGREQRAGSGPAMRAASRLPMAV